MPKCTEVFLCIKRMSNMDHDLPGITQIWDPMQLIGFFDTRKL